MKPVKPTLDGEPAYEDIALKFWVHIDFSKGEKERVPKGVLDSDGLIQDKSHFKDGFFDDYDVRVHAYWNFLAGACGYTYGNNAIWQMYKKGEGSAIPCLFDWRESMDRPGAFDLQHIRTLLEDKFYKIVPDQTIISGEVGEGENRIVAAGSLDNSFALVYLAKGQAVTVQFERLPGKVTARWFNPRNGEFINIKKIKNKKVATFTPPVLGIGNDWMLVLETN